MRFWLRWYWNVFRYKTGLTNASPQLHEMARVLRELGYKPTKRK